MKKYISLAIIFVLALMVTFASDALSIKGTDFKGNNKSIIAQKVKGNSTNAHETLKLFYQGKLLGVVTNKDRIDSFIDNYYLEHYAEDFPETKLNLGEDYYYEDGYNYEIYEDIDDKIINYIEETKGFSIYTNEISFSNENGIYAKIYVHNIEDFNVAKKQFLLNFVSEDSLEIFEQGKQTDALTQYGRRELSLDVKDKIIVNKAYANPELIKMNSNDVFDYLCYGDNKEREYYTVKEGETLEYVSSQNDNISLRLLMLINPDKISKTNQIVEPGTKLNVTYFKSPLTVVVKKELLKSEVINPPNPTYIEDETLLKGKEVIDVHEQSGSKNVVYEETYINGVLQKDLVKRVNSSVTKEPIQAVIRVGTKSVPFKGSGRYIWPINNPLITCHWGCYPGHRGLDIIDTYDTYGPIYAADTGRVIFARYSPYGWGNYVQIDHGNGVVTAYAHMSVIGVEEGDVVQRGDYIGNIGGTGRVSAEHLHYEFWIDGSRVDPCDIVSCGDLPSNDY